MIDSKKVDYKKMGKQNRQRGADTERRARKDLESKGWIVSKWGNNVKDNELVVVKNHFFKGRGMMLGAGFPDFIAFRVSSYFDSDKIYHEVIGVEAKSNGYLTKEEKEKCRWMLDNNIFSKILIAKKGKKRGEIIYTEFT